MVSRGFGCVDGYVGVFEFGCVNYSVVVFVSVCVVACMVSYVVGCVDDHTLAFFTVWLGLY